MQNARGWRLPDSLRAPPAATAATPAPRTSTVSAAAGHTPFSRRLAPSLIGGSAGGSGSASAGGLCTLPNHPRAARSRLAPPQSASDDIDSSDGEAPPQPWALPLMPSTPSDFPGPGPLVPSSGVTRDGRSGGRRSSGLVAGLSRPNQLGAALPAGARGGSRRPATGPLGQEAQRALHAVEADRSMLNAKHGLGGLMPLCADRLRMALVTPALEALLLRAVATSAASQPLVAVTCERLHPPPVDGAPHTVLLLQRATFEKTRLGEGILPLSADLLLLSPWCEHDGRLLGHHCQAVEPGAAEKALAGSEGGGGAACFGGGP